MTKSEAKNRIAELTREINYHNNLYYQESRSEISDYEFDQLLEQLQKLEEEFPELKASDSPTQRVGGTITKTFETVEHRYRMLSLGNTYSTDELLEFDKRVEKGLGHSNYKYVCELKFDGVALSLTYENGELVRGVTRGDGVRGDDITNNIRTISTIPLQVEADALALFEVRGEAFLSKLSYEKLNKSLNE